MARFKKLSLDEARESFTLLNEFQRRAVKGGCNECDMYRRIGETVYTQAEYNAMMNAGTWNGGYYCSGTHCVCDLKTVEVIGYGSSYGSYGTTTIYGSHCSEHDLYFGMNSSCPGCSGDSTTYGGSYGSGGYSGSSGGSGGGGFISLAPNAVIDMPSSIKDKFIPADQKQDKNLCVPTCIAQVVSTFKGEKMDITSYTLKCAEVLYEDRKKRDPNYIGNTLAVWTEIKTYGVAASDVDVLYDYFFTNVHIEMNNNTNGKIDMATYEGDMVMAVLLDGTKAHNVVILDILGNECVYYDPEIPTEYKKADLKDFTMIRRITSLKSVNI